LYRYSVSQSSELCRHNPLRCFSTSVFYCCYCWFRYGLSSETFGYTFEHSLVWRTSLNQQAALNSVRIP